MTIVRTYGYYQSPVTTPIVQIVALVLAVLALIMGAYLLIIGKRPWRGGENTRVAPRVGGLMVLGGVIVIVVVLLEARASRLAGHEDRLDNRLKG